VKTIDTLADDIKDLFGSALRGDSTTIDQDLLAKFGTDVAVHLQNSITARNGSRRPKTLYMSEVGKPCMRQIWYGYHYPSLAETMQSHTILKFAYGNVVEEMALTLAEVAGHTVEDRQKTFEWKLPDGWAVRGRQDAVIDGVVVDVKSCSPFGYQKFVEGLTDDNDTYGYRMQLTGYNKLGVDQGFLAVDKQNGKVGFFPQPLMDFEAKAMEVAEAMHGKEPPRSFSLKPMGTSGNMKLPTQCSYCAHKRACWRDANEGVGLRGFVYANGPVFLGTVERTPVATEISFDRTIETHTNAVLGKIT
jgi:hypothetical protein